MRLRTEHFIFKERRWGGGGRRFAGGELRKNTVHYQPKQTKYLVDGKVNCCSEKG